MSGPSISMEALFALLCFTWLVQVALVVCIVRLERRRRAEKREMSKSISLKVPDHSSAGLILSKNGPIAAAKEVCLAHRPDQ